ncbi:hypothetical protein K469DRAFT_401253 [Zopfia rhizophila CBS 207.26]|uniref:Uncharacterized protein n=1 Tax=Zopfia rhizophila CBS 207.26 TaxID=1314779 RepID=A0A6A6DG01_9PEZI|nr:hypothetical protein K469DRAFT_401253 [Zopfia rhizophila CBS 207.26]
MTLIPHLSSSCSDSHRRNWTRAEPALPLDLYASANHENASPSDEWRIMAPGGAACGPWREREKMDSPLTAVPRSEIWPLFY